MKYVRRFVFKEPKLNVMNAEENSQYEGYARECVFQIYGLVQKNVTKDVCPSFAFK